ncbi:MAG: hypothetical protein K6E31_01860 [bacterium]|nr:hypothetical protein [bacterium]
MNEKRRLKNCLGVKVAYATAQWAVFRALLFYRKSIGEAFSSCRAVLPKIWYNIFAFSGFLCAAFYRRMMKFLCPKGGKAVRFASQYAHDAPVS